MMRNTITIIIAMLIWSCGSKTEQRIEFTQQTESTDTAQETSMSMSFPIEMDMITQYGSFKVEEIKRGKLEPDFLDNGLTEVRYNIYQDDLLLSSIEIVSSDFAHLYNKDFAANAKIWESQILSIDTIKRVMVITNNVRHRESDHEKNVLCVADFTGKKSCVDSSSVDR